MLVQFVNVELIRVTVCDVKVVGEKESAPPYESVVQLRNVQRVKVYEEEGESILRVEYFRDL